MCGVAGWVTFSRTENPDRDVVGSMIDTLACRGPDGRGLWSDGAATLGHTRLAVIDVAGGAQPMVAEEDGRVLAVVTYNGEVYNAGPLRHELEARGHRFKTRCDTEVLLHAYLEWGEHCPERLDGMFAFAVWDPGRQRLLLARDRLGIKPMHYAVLGDQVVFGSEPKALLAHPQLEPVVDLDGLREVFSMAPTPGGSVFRDVHELRPGTVLSVRPGRPEYRAYWSLEARPHEAGLSQTVDEVRELLFGIVDRELVSDVPLALLLSGGLDSSALTAVAARVQGGRGGGPVCSLTMSYQGYSENFAPDLVRSAPDEPYARSLADHVGALHREVVLQPEELMDPSSRLACLLAQDRPRPFGDMDTSALLGFRAVREHARVALIGEAADEIFGGYSWIHIEDLVHEEMFPWISFEKWHPGTCDGLGRGLLDPGFSAKLDLQAHYEREYRQALSEVPRLPGETGLEARMREICHLQLTRWLPMLLDRNDRLSMASGLELRVPFCDHRLVEYLYNVPWAMKTHDGREKSVLRAAVRDLLPDDVLQRPKSPFPVSQDVAYTRELHAGLLDTLADPSAPVTAFVDRSRALALVGDCGGGPQDWLFRMNAEMVLQLNAWLAHYRIRLAF